MTCDIKRGAAYISVLRMTRRVECGHRALRQRIARGFESLNVFPIVNAEYVADVRSVGVHVSGDTGRQGGRQNSEDGRGEDMGARCYRVVKR